MKQELLAPAGDIEAGYAALYYGADAVYLGLRKFSARATATNFDEARLDEFTAYAHHLGRKVYAAINTVLQEDELPELIKTLDICSRCQIDAVILQDLGVAHVIRSSYPELEMHASTQMAVHNKEGALFLKSLGFTRVVLARELTLAEIKEIAAIEGLETEAFIHGALCYSYSGLCQFSALENGRSANRGKCLYPCRACFTGEAGKKHIFSMKDMALGADVLQMPVTSLKIEGRKKTALYVAAVTDYYRRILDGKSADVSREENIKQIFSRPWCKFHFHGKNKQIVDPDFVGHRGLEIGKIAKISGDTLGFTTSHEISRYDGLQIDVPGKEKPFGFSIQNLRVNGKNVYTAEKGAYVEVALPDYYPFLKKGWQVYLASSCKVKGSYDYEKPRPEAFRNGYPLDVVVTVREDQIEAVCGTYRAVLEGRFTEAQHPEKINAAITESFVKTGGTPLALKSLVIKNDKNIFVPLSQINDLRRQLYQQIVPVYKKGMLPEIPCARDTAKPQWLIKIDDLSCLKEVDLHQFSEVIYQLTPQTNPSDLAVLPKNKVRLALPAVCRHPQIFATLIARLLEQGYKKWEVGNYWALQMLPLSQIDLSLDSSVYMFNSQAQAEAQAFGANRITFAMEDTLNNINALSASSSLKTTFVVYQDAPLFTSVGCIRQNDCRNCRGGTQWFELEKDGKKYQALSRDCQIMLFSAQPLCLASEAAKVRTDYYRMDFLHKNYTPRQVAEISRQLLAFTDVAHCSKGNINNQEI